MGPLCFLFSRWILWSSLIFLFETFIYLSISITIIILIIAVVLGLERAISALALHRYLQSPPLPLPYHHIGFMK